MLILSYLLVRSQQGKVLSATKSCFLLKHWTITVIWKGNLEPNLLFHLRNTTLTTEKKTLCCLFSAHQGREQTLDCLLIRYSFGGRGVLLGITEGTLGFGWNHQCEQRISDTWRSCIWLDCPGFRAGGQDWSNWIPADFANSRGQPNLKDHDHGKKVFHFKTHSQVVCALLFKSKWRSARKEIIGADNRQIGSVRRTFRRTLVVLGCACGWNGVEKLTMEAVFVSVSVTLLDIQMDLSLHQTIFFWKCETWSVGSHSHRWKEQNNIIERYKAALVLWFAPERDIFNTPQTPACCYCFVQWSPSQLDFEAVAVLLRHRMLNPQGRVSLIEDKCQTPNMD